MKEGSAHAHTQREREKERERRERDEVTRHDTTHAHTKKVCAWKDRRKVMYMHLPKHPHNMYNTKALLLI